MALETHHGTRTIQDFLDLYSHKRLNLSPAFQRQSVWSSRDRQHLVSSIFDSIPLPSVYLYRQTGRGGTPLFDVIDGKQRLETLLLFMGKGPLRRVEDTLHVRRAFGDDQLIEWRAWSDLTTPDRNDYLNAIVPTIEVEGELGEVIDLFVRINSTGKHLTAQERRHAHYYTSPVLRMAQRLADGESSYLQANRVIAPAQRQRMRHVELITELLLAVEYGMPLNKKQKLDQVIQNASVDAASLRVAEDGVRRALRVTRVVLPHLKTTRFHQIADFYTLVLLLHRYYEEGLAVSAHNSQRNALAGALLTDFGRGVDEVSEKIRSGKGILPVEEPFREYLMTVRTATDSKSQRDARERILRSLLDGVFEERDATRGFNAIQRRVLWHASAVKRCSICKLPIKRWDDMSVDHVIAHVKGGKTNLSNAALAHKRCNARKGAR